MENYRSMEHKVWNPTWKLQQDRNTIYLENYRNMEHKVSNQILKLQLAENNLFHTFHSLLLKQLNQYFNYNITNLQLELYICKYRYRYKKKYITKYTGRSKEKFINRSRGKVLEKF